MLGTIIGGTLLKTAIDVGIGSTLASSLGTIGGGLLATKAVQTGIKGAALKNITSGATKMAVSKTAGELMKSSAAKTGMGTVLKTAATEGSKSALIKNSGSALSKFATIVKEEEERSWLLDALDTVNTVKDVKDMLSSDEQLYADKTQYVEEYEEDLFDAQNVMSDAEDADSVDLSQLSKDELVLLLGQILEENLTVQSTENV